MRLQEEQTLDIIEHLASDVSKLHDELLKFEDFKFKVAAACGEIYEDSGKPEPGTEEDIIKSINKFSNSDIKFRKLLKEYYKSEDPNTRINNIDKVILDDDSYCGALNDLQDKPKKPTVVCLCGSTKFYETFQRVNYEETMLGKIVLSVGFFCHSANKAHGENVGCTEEQKIKLDELHKRKIDLADEVFILNVGGYIGESTRSELEYAKKHNKVIRYLEPYWEGK